MKKLMKNNFIRLPLFLACICLIFTALLAITNHFTAPIISSNIAQQEAKAFDELYGPGKISSVDTTEINSAPINSVSRLEMSDSSINYAYNLTTADPQSGAIQILIGISSEAKVNAYAFIAAPAGQTYLGSLKDNAAVSAAVSGYDGTGDFYAIQGATKTANVVKAAVDAALEHYAANYGGNN